MRTRRLAGLVVVLASGLAASPVIVLAQGVDADRGVTPLDEAGLERLIADLDSDDPGTRESATQALASDPRLSLSRLERFLTGPALSREQRRRLFSAAFERFAGEPRAAMGVSFEPLPRESGVRLATVVPSFPCAGLLKPGDRVLTFDGAAVLDQQQAVAIIVSHDPGDEIQVGLQRDGETLTVGVPLGRRDRLENPVAVAGPMLTGAWAIRSRAYARDAEPAVIDSGLAAGAWGAAGGPAPEQSVAIVAGGEARGGYDPGVLGRDGQGRVVLDATTIRQLPPGRMDRRAGRDAQNQIAAQRRILRDAIERLQSGNEQRREMLRRPDLLPEQRREIERAIQLDDEAIREHYQMLRILDSQNGRPPR